VVDACVELARWSCHPAEDTPVPRMRWRAGTIATLSTHS
jgi:hypothetical protein